MTRRTSILDKTEFDSKVRALSRDDFYQSPDFQCAQTGGYPTMLCVNWDEEKAWLMINESARILHEVKDMKKKLDFRYIIVDEYQDISRQRFDLVTALHEVTDAKIVAVGDDWQSIYAFSGSDISLFTKFQEKMGYAKLLKIVKTYRNSQEVIDIAGNFIQKNDSQIKKDLVSPKTITDPVIIYTYDGKLKKQGQDRRSGANFALASAVETALGQIIEYNKAEGKTKSTILLLGRYGFDGDLLERSGLFEYITRGNKYLVKIEDAEAFNKRQHTDKKLIADLAGLFTSRTEHHPLPKAEVSEETLCEYRRFVEERFRAEPEALSVTRICELTSMVGMTVHRLIASGILYGTKVQGKTFCSKSTLIDYLASEDTFRNPTCEGCKELVRTFKRRKSDDTYNEQRRERRKLEREKKGSGT